MRPASFRISTSGSEPRKPRRASSKSCVSPKGRAASTARFSARVIEVASFGSSRAIARRLPDQSGRVNPRRGGAGPPERIPSGLAAEGGNDSDGGGGERESQNGPEQGPRLAMGKVEGGAEAGDLGHPQSWIPRIVVDDAVPSLETAQLSGPAKLAVQRLERPPSPGDCGEEDEQAECERTPRRETAKRSGQERHERCERDVEDPRDPSRGVEDGARGLRGGVVPCGEALTRLEHARRDLEEDGEGEPDDEQQDAHTHERACGRGRAGLTREDNEDCAGENHEGQPAEPDEPAR